MKDFVNAVVENGAFFAQFMGIVVLIFVIAAVSERLLLKSRISSQIPNRTGVNIQKITAIGLFSAMSFVIMMFDFPVPFAPPFYKLDFSEIPVLIVSFSFGPVAGVLTEFLKILLKLLFRSTSSAFVGELANFVIGCALILPASIVYHFKKTRNTAIIGCITGITVMTVFGVIFNEIYLLPTFSKVYSMPLDALIQAGTKINPAIVNIRSFVLFAVLPLNLLKGFMVCVVVIALYKSLRSVLRKY